MATGCCSILIIFIPCLFYSVPCVGCLVPALRSLGEAGSGVELPNTEHRKLNTLLVAAPLEGERITRTTANRSRAVPASKSAPHLVEPLSASRTHKFRSRPPKGVSLHCVSGAGALIQAAIGHYTVLVQRSCLYSIRLPFHIQLHSFVIDDHPTQGRHPGR